MTKEEKNTIKEVIEASETHLKTLNELSYNNTPILDIIQGLNISISKLENLLKSEKQS